MSLLEQIHSPSDLQRFNDRELQVLADEIREFMIGAVSKVGGHLAPSLGVVELTLALHSVLDSPRDKIIWDVGHQCYAHKIITGRAASFHTIRQYGGLSGFPSRSESEHDIVGTGHSSTSISHGVGIQEAIRLAAAQAELAGVEATVESGKSLDGEAADAVAAGAEALLEVDGGKEVLEEVTGGHVACVIGDGALTGGIAYEALNQAGHLKTPLIVILNDNEMSIKPNVGAISQYLHKLRLDPTLYKLREELEHGLDKIPGIRGASRSLKESMKAFLVPGMLFEELGFAYIGIVDGHDVKALRKSIRAAMEIERPVLIHIKTTKGKGYEPAEARPDTFHGIAPFSISTGEAIKKPGPITYTEAFGQGLARMAADDEKIVAITAAMSSGTGLYHFERSFPDRFFDVGIAEEHAVAFAAGLAIGGFKPVVAIYSTFLQRAFDLLVQDVALQDLPVVFALDRAGLVGDDGPTHHGILDLGYLSLVPGMTVMAPGDEAELQNMLFTALSLGGPAAIRYPRLAGRGVAMPENFELLPVGKAEVIDRGEGALLLGLGTGVGICRRAARMLAERFGLRPTVVNARFLKPLDESLIRELAAEHELVITVEEGTRQGGFGAAVRELLAEEAGVPIKSFAVPDRFVSHGNRNQLLRDIGLTPEAVADYVGGKLLEKKIISADRRKVSGDEYQGDSFGDT
ncbi:MAG: 1-deoxy-D-xylulose-5-phosphate synthase [Actinobacteria bacterium]|nr:1-deoxy-D-xylulose-5-phosphate synthase [Actinomycetota bacterium]